MSAVISHSFHFNMRPIVFIIYLVLDVFLNLMLRLVIRRSIVRDLEVSVPRTSK